MTGLRSVVPFAAMLLAGCGVFGPATPVSPQEAACRREAEDSPAVKAIMNKMEGNQNYQREHMEDLEAAKQDATVACLQSRGTVRRGGVERQKPLQ